MVLWGFRWFKLFLNPYANDDFEHISESDRRIYILERLEDAEFSEWSWVVVVAGVGFFTDAYSIFAINMVLPILGIIYYGGTMPHNYETALAVVTLGGSIIGQVGFGFAADIWGRRKMYGVELIITIGATLGVVMSSNGTNGSMHIIAWLLAWRFVLGIGIGADYPLSAVICSEQVCSNRTWASANTVLRFAPTRLRGRMLTAVFMCQPLGQLAATLVALIAAARQRKGIPSDAYPGKCDDECIQTLDSIWRWIIGVGVIPAVIAIWFRLTIIESPRYTADVGRDSRKAASELNRYLLLQAQAQARGAASSNSSVNNIPGHQRIPEPYLRRPSSGAASVASGAESVVSGVQSGAASVNHASLREISPMRQNSIFPGDEPANGGPTPEKAIHVKEARPVSGAMSAAGHSQRHFAPRLSHFTDHASIDHHPDESHLPSPEEITPPPPPSWQDFKEYFWHNGNLRTLLATSFCWFCVDLPFYGLGMNSPHIITTIWYGKNPPNLPIYPLLVHNVWQSLVVVSLGAIVGCLITFVTIDKLGRRNIQVNGFFWLFVLFIVIGGSFNHLYEIGGSSAIVVLYILAQIFFNFGPNTTTYIFPAELFPTRYRGLCHGISAAFGKLGSVIAQLFLAYINYGQKVNYNTIQKWLPYSLLIFSIFMLLGLIVTIVWLPGQEHTPSGTIKTLEDWQDGRPTPNRFAQTRLAKIVESVWKVAAKVGDKIYLVIDSLAGGDERERRELEKERERGEMAEEMERVSEDLHEEGAEREEERGQGRADEFGLRNSRSVGAGSVSVQRGPSPFVNGRPNQP